jgi:hypothetical protein
MSDEGKDPRVSAELDASQQQAVVQRLLDEAQAASAAESEAKNAAVENAWVADPEISKRLVAAVYAGDLKEVKDICYVDPMYAEKSVMGDSSMLTLAAFQGFAEMVRYFVTEQRVYVNRQNKNGCTALYVAAEMGNGGVVEALIEGKANLNAANSDGDSALGTAAENGNLGIVKMLLDAGANCIFHDNEGRAPLFRAYAVGAWETVAYLINALDCIDINSTRTMEGFNLLMAAAYDNDLDAVKHIVGELGADVHSTGPEDGLRAIHVATFMEHKEVANFLWEAADKKASDSTTQDKYTMPEAIAAHLKGFTCGYCTKLSSPYAPLKGCPCKLAKYCNPDCQRDDWRSAHKALHARMGLTNKKKKSSK